MNARTIRKRLMRHRRNVFWGRRAYLTISVPLSLYPESLPPFVPPGLPDFLEGHWRNEDDSKKWYIGQISCGTKPEEDRANVVGLHLSHWGNSWEWYEGQELTMDGEKVAARKPLPEEMILAYARRMQWIDKWLHGSHGFAEGELSTPIALLLLCSNWARSTHASVDGQRVLISWGVKWFYANRKLRFCRDVARFLAAARRMKLDARVWR
ncbi:MAG: hypothetical protein HY369_04310 [Candidatus Aenigmarchaeota archaeon]|nr:hypothetical protein [Candidatus Aenigmarchaeota archaeon]